MAAASYTDRSHQKGNAGAGTGFYASLADTR